ncbi:MAG: 4-hydroxybenzoate 3-monooxygenase [Bauldia sp.]|uniref:4-hydroxybenzoate 3-monooxygenase n=1 Tax=Bauldia sp. TaxID=2575872 RepID=UPI001DF75A76|nr:4-hydroxybenzoate 3-monooxygenase [Bauldia sp.]MCB1496382.1 4-hydroxybenzoate 3-monooxygenase [Bauldia sp.]
MKQRTQVGIVGAGPSGLLLSHLLARQGIDSIVIEDRSRDHVENRVRAGVLEQGTVDTLIEAGLGERMLDEGLIHDGIEIRFNGERHRVDFPSLTDGKRITIYGQGEVVKDLIDARLADGGVIHFEVSATSIHDIDGDAPVIRYRKDEAGHEIACDYIAGCDGFHGICRESVPEGILTGYERVYPYAWLGVLSDSPPAAEEVAYCHSDRGFALLSLRSPAVSRLYLQVAPDEDIEAWPDERFWEELRLRSATKDDGAGIEPGPVLQKGITPMRSYVVEPMRHGRLFLAGDAAHIVPPTGAKGMNLAVADIRYLTEALAAFYRAGDAAGLDAYSTRALRRVWKAQRFSWWMTTMLHLSPDDSPFDRRRQIGELDYVTTSVAAMTALAENYVGLPLDDGGAP